jgi:type IV pilus assembly protein PilB
MFAVLRCVDAYQYTIYTLGDRQGWDLPNVGNFERSEDEDLDTYLDRALRAEADVIYLDPIRDQETARLVVGRASRATFISEFPAPDVYSAPAQFAKLLGDPAAAAENLSAILSQRLIRTLCNDCKMAFRPNPKLLARVGLPPETKTLYRPPPPPQEEPVRPEDEVEPCDTCGATGYIGRTAMFELLEVTEPIRKLISEGAAPQAIKSEARKEKMFTLQQEGLRLVVAGRTSMEELQRVFQPRK